MSKELVISSNRHDTKVAILEEDQLVEIYFQHANEYSLAGSIHKGRVTRVLPGMQSAFVDLGLDRDTFLYVSDFFEENGEDFDRVTDEKPVRTPHRQEGNRNTPAHLAPVAVRNVVEPEILTEPVSLAPVIPIVPDQAPSAGAPDSRDQGDKDRKGRRGRRRRSRAGGFPDSKYASIAGDAPEDSSIQLAPETVEVESDDSTDDVILLPGESLAKYRKKDLAEQSSEDPEVVELRSESTTVSDLAAVIVPEPEQEAELHPAPTRHLVDLTSEGVASAFPEPGFVPFLVVPKPDVSSEPSAEAELVVEPELVNDPEPVIGFDKEEFLPLDEDAVSVVEPENSAVLAFDPTFQIAPIHPPNQEHATVEAGSSVAESTDFPEIIPITDADPTEEPEPSIEDPDSEEPPQNDPDSGEPGSGEPPPEQALSASVRDQGNRAPHRSSRRMRRRRGGDNGQQQRSQSEQSVAEPVVELPTVVQAPERVLPSITDLLKEGQEIIVQIAKEPLGQKGARITSHIALPGRYVVYMPTLEHLGVSRKIASDEERHRLKRVLQAARGGMSGGFIVRTAGEGHTEEEIAADMAYLYNLWLDIRQKAEKRPSPLLLHHDLDIVQRILRDQLNDMFKAIWCDNEEVYESILRFMQRFQPSLVGRVKMYTRPTPIFDAFSVTQEIEKALRPKVWLKSGGYIVINQTEALVAIDVNTGKYVGKSNRLEDTITKTNTEAVKEIVRQIRLRDLGGIIVVDFIDMDERKNRQKVMQTLEEAMQVDRAPYKILQFNDFGLVAITRKRVKQSLERSLCTPCPTCEGASYVKSIQTVVGEILQEAVKVRPLVEGKNVILRAYPDVAKFLKLNTNTYLEELEETLQRPVIVTSDPLLHPEKFDLAW